VGEQASGSSQVCQRLNSQQKEKVTFERKPLKKLIGIIALAAASVGAIGVASNMPTASAASSCGADTTYGTSPIPHNGAVAYCANLNYYSPQISQLGEQVRVKVLCEKLDGTDDPAGYRYGPYVNLQGTSSDYGDWTKVSHVSCDTTSGGYMWAVLNSQAYEINNWTQTSYYAFWYYDGNFHYTGGKVYSPAEYWFDGGWLRVIVQCGSGNPWHAGDKVYTSGTNSYYQCGTFGGDGPYATAVNYEFGFN
jgi:hypothetical protein